MSYNVRGKVAVVTGGAMGLGEGIVRELLEQKAKCVFLLDVNVERARALEKELNTKYGTDKAVFISCDVSDESQLNAAYSQLSQQDCIDVVFNNAGVYDETENFRRMIAVNVSGVMGSTLHALRLMRVDCGGRGGTVVNVASLAAFTNTHLFPMYGATKCAVVHFTKSIGLEPLYSRTKVRVLSVCPDATDTQMIRNIRNQVWDPALKGDVGTLMDTVTCSMQSTEYAAKAILEVYAKGESASSWLISRGSTADITNLTTSSGDGLRSLMSAVAMEALGSLPRNG